VEGRCTRARIQIQFMLRNRRGKKGKEHQIGRCQVNFRTLTGTCLHCTREPGKLHAYVHIITFKRTRIHTLACAHAPTRMLTQQHTHPPL